MSNGKTLVQARSQRVAPKDKNYYIQRAVKYSTIGWDELCGNIARSLGVSKAVATASASAIVEQMRQLMLNGHSIRVGNIGYLRFGISAKAVDREEALNVGLVKCRRVLFIPTSDVKKSLKNIEFEVRTVQEHV